MIFVDTSFWVALKNRRDTLHDEAVARLRAHGHGLLATSNHVQGETWNLIQSRCDHRTAVEFLDELTGSARVVVFRASDEHEEQAWAWLRVHDERRYSFVDATSFAVMKSLRIRDALAFDGDFAAAGFNELRA